MDADHVNYYRFFLPIAIAAVSLSGPTARQGFGDRDGDGDDADGLRPLPDRRPVATRELFPQRPQFHY
jgi:hypothetical protein